MAQPVHDNALEGAQRAFEEHNVSKDLGIKFTPTKIFEVNLHQEDGPPLAIHLGMILPRKVTHGPPHFRLFIAPAFPIPEDERGPYVIVIVDPDAPTPQRPTSAQYRHFLGTNFFANRWTGWMSFSNPPITPYMQPSPPAGSDPHRYVFLLYKQPTDFHPQSLITHTSPRHSFDVAEFARRTGLGDPIGGTFVIVGPGEA